MRTYLTQIDQALPAGSSRKFMHHTKSMAWRVAERENKDTEDGQAILKYLDTYCAGMKSKSSDHLGENPTNSLDCKMYQKAKNLAFFVSMVPVVVRHGFKLWPLPLRLRRYIGFVPSVWTLFWAFSQFSSEKGCIYLQR